MSFVDRRARFVAWCARFIGPLVVMSAAAAGAQPAQPTAGPARTLTFFARDWTRVEMWRFFEPNPGGGDPDYADIATRLQVGVEGRASRYEVTAALQFVQFAGLPAHATGPGPLGTGALYFDQGGGANSRT